MTDPSGTQQPKQVATSVARKEALLKANRRAVARLTPEEKEYRALMARISSYRKFLRERTDPSTADAHRHRRTYLTPDEIVARLAECGARAIKLRPVCLGIAHQRMMDRGSAPTQRTGPKKRAEHSDVRPPSDDHSSDDEEPEEDHEEHLTEFSPSIPNATMS
jgi:hypothetical protein